MWLEFRIVQSRHGAFDKCCITKLARRDIYVHYERTVNCTGIEPSAHVVAGLPCHPVADWSDQT